MLIMNKTNQIVKLLRCSLVSWNAKTCRCITPTRNYSKDLKELKENDSKQVEENNSKELEKKANNEISFMDMVKVSPNSVQIWNERSAIKRTKRKNRFYNKIDNMTDFLITMNSINAIPLSFNQLYHFFRRRVIKRELLEQKYLPERHQILKADLAAAHFIVARGGSVKFLGQTDWIGSKEERKSLPICYAPGLFIEAINAEGTRLYLEGLKNLCQLRHLTSLSLKGLQEIDDWCLDWLSNEYKMTLQHLDLTDCKNVTYRGFSCFYRFESLQTLSVGGIAESPEFKTTLLMLLDVFPKLEIHGIDLSIPQKIDPIDGVLSIADATNKIVVSEEKVNSVKV